MRSPFDLEVLAWWMPCVSEARELDQEPCDHGCSISTVTVQARLNVRKLCSSRCAGRRREG